MRVLVTRSESAAEGTMAQLRHRGHEPVLLPLASPVHDLDAALAALAASHGALAVTSAEALRVLDPFKDRLAPYRKRPLFAVGAATAQAARRLGFDKVVSANGDGATLAERLADEARPADGPVLYLAGHPRAHTLEQGLLDRTVAHVVVEVYRMQPCSYEESDILARLGARPVDAVLLYSAETARRFFSLPLGGDVAPLFGRARFLCLSEQVARAVPDTVGARVSWADQPREDRLLACL